MGRDTPTAATAELASRLHAERAALRAFITLLEAEQQALLEGQAEQLLVLAGDKTLAAQDLSQLANARRNDLIKRGAGTEPDGLVAWLQAQAADSLPVWLEVRRLAGQAQQINSVNGKLIQVKLRHNQHALSVLNNAAQGASGLYGPDGHSQLHTSGRILGSV